MAENTKTPEQLENEKLQAEIAELRKANSEKDELIQEQLVEIENTKAQVTDSRPVFTHEKKQYKLLAHKVNIDGTEYTGAEVAKSKDLINKLLESKSGLLQPVAAK